MLPRPIQCDCKSRNLFLSHKTARVPQGNSSCILHLSARTSILSNIPNYSNLSLSSIEVDKNLEFEVAQILDSKWDKQKRDLLLYYVYWASYEGTVEEFSWFNISDLQNAKELVTDFHILNPTKPGPKNALLSTWRPKPLTIGNESLDNDFSNSHKSVAIKRGNTITALCNMQLSHYPNYHIYYYFSTLCTSLPRTIVISQHILLGL